LIGYVLSFIGGLASPLTIFGAKYASRMKVTVAASEYTFYIQWSAMALEAILLPFTASLIIYLGMRLLFWLGRGNMGNYIDYLAITYYVSMTILAVYGFVFFLWLGLATR
jgi:hypothetical protein